MKFIGDVAASLVMLILLVDHRISIEFLKYTTNQMQLLFALIGPFYRMVTLFSIDFVCSVVHVNKEA